MEISCASLMSESSRRPVTGFVAHAAIRPSKVATAKIRGAMFFDLCNRCTDDGV